MRFLLVILLGFLTSHSCAANEPSLGANIPPPPSEQAAVPSTPAAAAELLGVQEPQQKKEPYCFGDEDEKFWDELEEGDEEVSEQEEITPRKVVKCLWNGAQVVVCSALVNMVLNAIVHYLLCAHGLYAKWFFKNPFALGTACLAQINKILGFIQSLLFFVQSPALLLPVTDLIAPMLCQEFCKGALLGTLVAVANFAKGKGYFSWKDPAMLETYLLSFMVTLLANTLFIFNTISQKGWEKCLWKGEAVLSERAQGIQHQWWYARAWQVVRNKSIDTVNALTPLLGITVLYIVVLYCICYRLYATSEQEKPQPPKPKKKPMQLCNRVAKDK